MSSTAAYACDGEGCVELVHREPGKRYPASWARVTVSLPDGTSVTGAFHSSGCAVGWLSEKLTEPAVVQPVGGGPLVPSAPVVPPGGALGQQQAARKP